jgi:large subunit ribosomal protein L20
MRTKVKRILRLAKGYYGRAKSCYRIAKNRVEKGLQYAYVSRKLRKREKRSEWISSINAATREQGVRYSEFMSGLLKQNVGLNRKMLALLAQNEPLSFSSILSYVVATQGYKRTASHVRRGIRSGLVASTQPLPPVIQYAVETPVYEQRAQKKAERRQAREAKSMRQFEINEEF